MCPASHRVRRGLAATCLITLLCGSACQAWRTERTAAESLLGIRHPTKLLVTRTDGEARIGEDAARGDVDGQTTDLKHDGMLRAARGDVLSHIKRPGGRSK